uniref:DUF4794 domain-containing protein n=1 Tax=Glossina brevipalpis TaxID=37001 RepID=A0A1A9WNB5_9MUSC
MGENKFKIITASALVAILFLHTIVRAEAKKSKEQNENSKEDAPSVSSSETTEGTDDTTPEDVASEDPATGGVEVVLEGASSETAEPVEVSEEHTGLAPHMLGEIHPATSEVENVPVLLKGMAAVKNLLSLDPSGDPRSKRIKRAKREVTSYAAAPHKQPPATSPGGYHYPPGSYPHGQNHYPPRGYHFIPNPPGGSGYPPGGYPPIPNPPGGSGYGYPPGGYPKIPNPPGGSGYPPGGSDYPPGGSGYPPGGSGYPPGGSGYPPGGYLPTPPPGGYPPSSYVSEYAVYPGSNINPAGNYNLYLPG